MHKSSFEPKRPRSLSPTPLRDWIARQRPVRRAALALLFAFFIACGGHASIHLAFTPVPVTQQLLFALLAGALLGSRLGAVAAVTYLLASSLPGGAVLWPDGAGTSPLIGPLGGYLWSLPLVSFVSGFVVEKAKSEATVFFAFGVTAAIGIYNAFGTLRLFGAMDMGMAEAAAKGSGFFVGLHAAQGALAVMIASTASSSLQAREPK